MSWWVLLRGPYEAPEPSQDQKLDVILGSARSEAGSSAAPTPTVPLGILGPQLRLEAHPNTGKVLPQRGLPGNGTETNHAPKLAASQ